MRSRPRLARALPLALALACAKTPDGGDTAATDTSSSSSALCTEHFDPTS